MFLNLLKRKTLAFTIATIMIITPILIENVNASFINTSGSSGVIIDCVDYFGGMKNIDIYSNLTVKNYNLKLNGTIIRNTINPVQNQSGYWIPSATMPLSGDHQSGNVRGLDYDDSNHYYIESVQISGKEYVTLEVYFSPTSLPVDTSDITSSRVESSILITKSGAQYPNVRNLQFYNRSTSSWQTIASFASTGGLINSTVNNLIGQIGGFSDCIRMRFQLSANSPSYDFQVNASFFHIYYESSKQIEISNCYELTDTFLFNSSMYPDGIYNLTAEIKDGNNNLHVDQKWITIDNTLPTIQDLTVTPSSPDSTDIITINTTIFDTNLESNLGEYTNVFGNITQIPNGNNQIFNFKTILPNGSYNFFVFASDKAGNINYKNKTFIISYYENIVYVNSPSIIITRSATAFINETSWINATCNYIGNLSIYVNSSMVASFANPTSIDFNLNSSTDVTYNVTIETFYLNGTFFNNVTFLVTFTKKPKYVLPSIVISHGSSAYIHENATTSIEFHNGTNANLYVNGVFNVSFTEGSYQFNDTSTFIVKNNYTVEIFDYENNFYKNVSFSIEFIEKDYITTEEPSWKIIFNNESYMPNPLSMNITTSNVSAVYIYVNGSINQTFSGNTTNIFSINSGVESDFLIDLIIQLINGTNKTLHFIASILDIPVTVINSPSFIWSHEIENNNLNITVWSNFTSQVKVYVNSTLNQTLPGNSTSNIWLPSIEYASYVFTVEIYDPFANLYITRNVTVNIESPINDTVIYPQIILSFTSKSFTGDVANVFINSANIINGSLYVNGIYNSTFVNGEHQYNFTSSIPIINNYTIEIFDIYNDFYKNTSFSIQFVDKEYLTIESPSWNVTYNNVSYMPDPVSMTISTVNITSVYVHVNGSLNQTFSGNSTDTFNIYSSFESTFNIDVIMMKTDGTNSTLNFTATIKKIPESYITIPSFAWSHETNDNNVTMDIWSNFTSELKLYINGTYNQTISGNLSQIVPFTSIAYGKYVFTLEIYDTASSLYYTRNVTVNVLQPIITMISRPSVLISYPPSILVMQPSFVNIETQYSDGFNLEIKINDSVQNSTFYNGSGSFSFGIPSITVSNVSFDFEIFDDDNNSWKNISISIQVVEPMIIYKFLTIDYDNIVYTNHFLFINGTGNFNFDPKVYKNNILVLVDTNVSNFYYQFNVSTSLSDVNIKVEVYENTILIYLREFKISVRPEYVIPEETEPGIIDIIASQWMFFLALAIIVPFLAYVDHRRRSCEVKGNRKGVTGTRKIDIPSRKKDAVESKNSRNSCKKLL